MTREKPLATTVPAGVEPAGECPYCGQPFRSTAARDLHVGEEHPDVCDSAEQQAYDAAFAAEEDEMFYFHLKIGFALGVTNAVLILAYLIVLG